MLYVGCVAISLYDFIVDMISAKVHALEVFNRLRGSFPKLGTCLTILFGRGNGGKLVRHHIGYQHGVLLIFLLFFLVSR